MRWKYLNTKVHFSDFLDPYWTSFVRKGVLVNWKESETVDIYIPPMNRTSIRTIERKIVRAPHVQSQWRTFSRTITWSLARSYRIILQHSLSLYNSRI